MAAKQRPDYLAIIVAIAGFLLQLAIGVFWFGGLSESVGDLKRRQDASELVQAQSNTNLAAQSTDTAVLTARLDYIKSVVDTMNGKLDSGKPR